jgi:hypothetical protein
MSSEVEKKINVELSDSRPIHPPPPGVSESEKPRVEQSKGLDNTALAFEMARHLIKFQKKSIARSLNVIECLTQDLEENSDLYMELNDYCRKAIEAINKLETHGTVAQKKKLLRHMDLDGAYQNLTQSGGVLSRD